MVFKKIGLKLNSGISFTHKNLGKFCKINKAREGYKEIRRILASQQILNEFIICQSLWNFNIYFIFMRMRLVGVPFRFPAKKVVKNQRQFNFFRISLGSSVETMCG